MSETLQPVTRGRLYHSAKVSNCFRPQATKASITLLINSCFRLFLLSFFSSTYAVFILKRKKNTYAEIGIGILYLCGSQGALFTIPRSYCSVHFCRP